MLGSIVVRFVLGGVIVSAFALAGELFQPKRFAGMSGAAPSVALASLALSFSEVGGRWIVRQEARSMVLGAVAMLACCATCVATSSIRAVPIWLSALFGWAAWFVVAFALLAAGIASGVLR